MATDDQKTNFVRDLHIASFQLSSRDVNMHVQYRRSNPKSHLGSPSPTLSVHRLLRETFRCIATDTSATLSVYRFSGIVVCLFSFQVSWLIFSRMIRSFLCDVILVIQNFVCHESRRSLSLVAWCSFVATNGLTACGPQRTVGVLAGTRWCGLQSPSRVTLWQSANPLLRLLES